MHRFRVWGPRAKRVSVVVDGERYAMEQEPRVALLDVGGFAREKVSQCSRAFAPHPCPSRCQQEISRPFREIGGSQRGHDFNRVGPFQDAPPHRGPQGIARVDQRLRLGLDSRLCLGSRRRSSLV